MAKQPTARELEIRDELREILKPGTNVRTILRHASKSGMSREISAVVVGKDGSVRDLDWMIVNAGFGFKFGKHGGIVMGGCGMDMGFSLVYSVSRSLYPNGYKCSGIDRSTKRANRCHSNDHTNYRPWLVQGDWDHDKGEWVGRVDNPKKNYSRGRKHNDGGYALSQQWM